MLLLTSTSDKIQLVTASAVTSINVHATYMDRSGSTITGGRKNTLVTTAATTDIVASPASSTERNVKLIHVDNSDGAVSTSVTLRHTDGTTAVDLATVTLLPGESLTLREDGEVIHRDAQGAEYQPSTPFEYLYSLGVAGTIAETMPRILCIESNLTAIASGTLLMTAIWLKAGQRISNIAFHSATTAAGTPTNQIFGLYDSSRALLASTNNDTTTAWAANTMKTLNLTSPFTATYTGLHYIGLLVTATTVPTFKGLAAKTGGQLAGQTPILHGASSTGLTTALPNPAAALTVNLNAIWGKVA